VEAATYVNMAGEEVLQGVWSSSLCEHGRQKSHARSAGGSSVIESMAEKRSLQSAEAAYVMNMAGRRVRSKEVWRQQNAAHGMAGRRVNTTGRCGGSSVCEHGRAEGSMQECKGTKMFEHGETNSQFRADTAADTAGWRCRRKTSTSTSPAPAPAPAPAPQPVPVPAPVKLQCTCPGASTATVTATVTV
jgi:hypothetical protein